MIVCSCNVLTDHDIRIVVTASREQPLSALQVYGCLGCGIRCGRCARAIKRIITEASIAFAEGRAVSVRMSTGRAGVVNHAAKPLAGEEQEIPARAARPR